MGIPRDLTEQAEQARGEPTPLRERDTTAPGGLLAAMGIDPRDLEP